MLEPLSANRRRSDQYLQQFAPDQRWRRLVPFGWSRQIQETDMFKHMLVATDGSKLSEEAVAYAISIAAPINAQVTALYVVQPVHAIVPAPLSETISEDFAARIEEQAKAAMAFVEETAHKAGVAVNLVTVRKEQPYKAIVEMAQSCRCDLIVMASHGHRPVSRFMLGGETQKVLAASNIPVLVYRSQAPTHGEAAQSEPSIPAGLS
jgi:nucleotide-binding universal stress UspA family protein